jgi:hypothetical protein
MTGHQTTRHPLRDRPHATLAHPNPHHLLFMGEPVMSTPRNNRWGRPPATPPSREPVPATQAHRAQAHGHGRAAPTTPRARTVGIVPAGKDEAPRVAEIITIALRRATRPAVTAGQRHLYPQIAYRLAQNYAAFHPLALDAARLRTQAFDEQGEHAQAGQLRGHLITRYRLTHQGLAPRLADQLAAAIRHIGGGDAAVLPAGQNLHLAASVADRISVLDAGRVALTPTGLDQLTTHRLAELLGLATAGHGS